MYRLFSDANYDFIGMRRRAYMVSGMTLLLGIVFAIYYQTTQGSWLKYGVDFTGGSLMRVEMLVDTDENELRRVIGEQIEGTEIVRSVNEYMIRTPTGEAADARATGEQIERVLTDRFGPKGEAYRVGGIDNVGAMVGGELQQKALIAIIISFAFVLIYLAIRYEWRFSLAAVLATVHDVLLTLCIIIIFRLDVSLDAVAAMLTILGYSLNDTVIIFDRIRENIRGKKIADLRGVLNRSINETLPRTTLTVMTTLATLFSLFLLGGDIIRIFATIMIVGILLGAYSSIFIASPALLAIEKKWPRPTTTTVRKPRTSSAAGARA